MGAVQITIKLRSVYNSRMTTRRTWLSLFSWVLDTAVIKWYIIITTLDLSWQKSHKRFSTSLVWDLIETGEVKIVWVSSRAIGTSIPHSQNVMKEKDAGWWLCHRVYKRSSTSDVTFRAAHATHSLQQSVSCLFRILSLWKAITVIIQLQQLWSFSMFECRAQMPSGPSQGGPWRERIKIIFIGSTWIFIFQCV